MSNQGHHTRNNTPPTENQTLQQSNGSTGQSSNDEMSLIARVESKLYFVLIIYLQNFLILKDDIIKNLQVENERLRNRVSYLSRGIVSLESNHNMLEQYGRRNNIKITGISDTVQDNELKNEVTKSFDGIGVEAKSADVEDCHRVGKFKYNSKKVRAKFVDQKVVKNVLYKRKQLKCDMLQYIGKWEPKESLSC